jgi:hypothetical protein
MNASGDDDFAPRWNPEAGLERIEFSLGWRRQADFTFEITGDLDPGRRNAEAFQPVPIARRLDEKS